jgi:type I restriction enzyme M protein
MPPQLFYTTQIPVSLWFLNKPKKQTNKTVFIDARNMGNMVSRKLRVMSNEDIMKIARTVDNFEAGTLENEKGFCAVADLEAIAKQDYILTPGRYVGIADVEEDSEPFDEKMARLTRELAKMFEQSHSLEEEIKKQLSSIGYKI